PRRDRVTVPVRPSSLAARRAPKSDRISHDGVARYGCGWFTALLTGPALIAALAHRGGPRWVSTAALGQLAVLMANPFVVSRNLSPCVPGIAVSLGWLVARLVERVPPRYRRSAPALAAALLIAAPGYDGLRMAATMREMDTRGLAAEWIAAHV